MTTTTQHLMVGLMMTALVGAGRTASAADLEASDRVRSSNAAIRALIQQASERSQTFRGLLETINASDGIVYVEEGSCGHSVRACFVTVTMAGPTRLLWVKVDTRTADCDLIGLIGHELRHTIEVLSTRTVTSGVAMYNFYRQVAVERSAASSGRAFETIAAVEAGEAVRAEVRHQSPRTKAQ